MGLGNPGKKYAATRHNVGFMVVDKIAQLSSLKFKKSFFNRAYVAGKNVNNESLLLVKPNTFMNESGSCLKRIIRRYNPGAQNICIVYDDVDLALGRIKFKTSGGCAGHKGMSSVINELGTEQVNRLRIGIGRPPVRDTDISAYVLSEFTEDRYPILNEVLDKAAKCCLEWLNTDGEIIMQKYNA